MRPRHRHSAHQRRQPGGWIQLLWCAASALQQRVQWRHAVAEVRRQACAAAVLSGAWPHLMLRLLACLAADTQRQALTGPRQ